MATNLIKLNRVRSGMNSFVEFTYEPFDYDALYLEAEESTENVGTRIVNGIKKIFAWIVKQVGRLIDWVKKFFVGKKEVKSATLIANEIIVRSETTTDAPKPSRKRLDPENASHEIETIIKDAEIITLTGNSDNAKECYLLHKMLENNCAFFNKGVDLLKGLGSQDGIKTKEIAVWLTDLDKLKARFPKDLNITFKFSELKAFQIKINELINGDWINLFSSDYSYRNTKKFNVGSRGGINVRDNILVSKRQQLDRVNKFGQAMVDIQKALGVVLDTIHNLFVLPEGYTYKAGPYQLADFAFEAIQYGHPPTSIARNLITIAGDKLKTEKAVSEGNIVSHRCDLFGEDYVYRYALSNVGKDYNKNEKYVTDVLKNDPTRELFCNVHRVDDRNGHVMHLMAKYKPGVSGDPKQLISKMNDALKKNDAELIIGKMGDNAIGGRDGEPILIDYGALVRIK